MRAKTPHLGLTVVQQLCFYFFTTLKSRLDVDSDDKAAVHKPFRCDGALQCLKNALIKQQKKGTSSVWCRFSMNPNEVNQGDDISPH